MHPPRWVGVLASLYGGVNEEVLLRLFLFTLIYFLAAKGVKNRIFNLWCVNLIVALFFGALHLPFSFKMGSLTGFEIFRILFLNGIGSLVFGWLYWTRGLWAAMIAHFAADLMIHVVLF